MPWYLSLVIAVVAGLIIQLVMLWARRRRPRLVVRVADPAQFAGPAGTETIQALSIVNSGNATASNVLATVGYLPAEPGRLSLATTFPEPDGSWDLASGTLVLRQPRLVVGDQIGVSFKVLGDRLRLDAKTVQVRADHGRGQLVTRESGGSTGILGVLAPMASMAGALIALLAFWRPWDMLQKPVDVYDPKVRSRLELRGDTATIQRLLGESKPHLELGLDLLAPVGGGVSRLAVGFINREPYPAERLSVNLSAIGCKLEDQPWLFVPRIDTGRSYRCTLRVRLQTVGDTCTFGVSADTRYYVLGVPRAAFFATCKTVLGIH